MIKYRLTTISVMISSLLVSCTDRLAEQKTVPVEEPAASEKLVFTPENAVAGKLLVYFSGEAAEKVEHSSLTRSGGPLTRSGIEEFDRVLENIGVRSLHRVFPVDKRNEERTRKAGLHRWYTVEFDETADLKEAALAMAAVAEVSKVEFNLRMERTSDLKTIPFAGTGNRLQQSSSEAVFNDPYLDLQWNYMNTGNTEIYSGIKAGADADCVPAWRLCTGDPRVVVAVVDDCVQWNHPDLEANMWINGDEIPGNGIDDDGNGLVDDIHGYNFVNDTSLTLSDGFDGSHGTHVAGTVAAVNGNGTGVCGIAGGSGSGDGARIMSCQIFHNEDIGNGTAEVSAKAIKYAADNGASILQCSFGYGAGAVTSDAIYAQDASIEKQAIDYFIGTKNCEAVDGGIVIFASGNDMSAMSAYPGAYKDYISVTAMACDYTPAYYTNYGYSCNVAAPGGDAYQSSLDNRTEASQILSTVNGSAYGYMQGTSMACPHVSGIAALGLSYALQLGKTFTVDEFNSILLTSVNDIDPYCTGTRFTQVSETSMGNLDLSRFKGGMGSGYIDAYQVLMNVRGTTCIPVPVGSQAQIDITSYIGDGNPNLTIVSAVLSDEEKDRLGMTSNPVKFGGNILLTCTKPGAGIMTVTLRAGTASGSGMEGKTVTKEFALIARPGNPANGGWL